MNTIENVKTVTLCAAIVLGCAAQADAQGRPPMRAHTVTESQPLELEPATTRYSGAVVQMRDGTGKMTIESNGVPGHTTGTFPNAGNPHSVSAQDFSFSVPKTPRVTGAVTELGHNLYFGVALNGVPFDPGAAEYWQGNRRSGWNYDALGGAVRLGLDVNHAHVQPTGSYHYHGVPTGLAEALGWTADTASPLIGYAADGFPVYLATAELDGAVQEMRSSYQLKPGNRPGRRAPSGNYDGTFVEDYEFVAGSGDLDACNGTKVTTAEYPSGTYAYFLTEEFPSVPRCLSGKPDRSFYKR